jgi:spermidine synthase
VNDKDDIVVERDGNSTVMKYKETGDVYSIVVDGSFYTGRLWDYFTIGPVLAENPKDILILGLGGGTVIKQFLGLFDARIDVVEISPKVVELAKAHFGIEESGRLKIFIDDAFDFVKKAGRKYDVIIVDAFEGDIIPEKFTTFEFMQAVASRLSEKGVAIANTITSGFLIRTSDIIFQNAERTFPSVFALDDQSNRLVICLSYKADRDYVIGRVDSFRHPLFEDLKEKIKSRIR